MDPRILATDGYKFSMAEAGFPLRQETFYYSHRRGGPHFLPFDVKEMIRRLLPSADAGQLAADDAFLKTCGYRLGGAFWEALRGDITVTALPKGSWFFDREPVFTVTGPSALVSWLEPLVLQLHYRIQVATLAKLQTAETWKRCFGVVSTQTQKDIVTETFAAVNTALPFDIVVDPEPYYTHVRERVAALIRIVQDPSRMFEVGMRAATCLDQHHLALQAAHDAGLTATSNGLAAQQLGLRAVGTMGHEHVQRFGSDEDAFRAMRDRHPGPTSFLLDTFSTIHSGLPTAFRLIAEDPSRADTVRFDSGDKRTQFLIACSMAQTMGVRPRFILEDGFTAEMTEQFETLRRQMDLPAEDVLYGYGGFIVKAPGDPLTRDRVAAVWKLTQSGPNPTMKFGDAPGSGKESIPGRPVLYRRFDPRHQRWQGVVAQADESLDDDVTERVSGGDLSSRCRFSTDEARRFAEHQGARPRYSAQTAQLVSTLTAARNNAIHGV